MPDSRVTFGFRSVAGVAAARAAAPAHDRAERFKLSLAAALTPPRIDIAHAHSDPDAPEDTMVENRIPMRAVPLVPKA